MHVSALALLNFRSYPRLDLRLKPGVTVFVGPNGVGKTNLVEAIGYLATLDSHRVSSDVPLVRAGEDHAVMRAQVRRGGREAVLEIQVNASGSNKARVNKQPVRARELYGILKTVLFAPEDLALVKGDPGERRRYLDELLTLRFPRFGAVRSDYERILKQRNALLKTARMGGSAASSAKAATLDVWDHHLAAAGGALLAGRFALVRDLRPHVEIAYAQVSGDSSPERQAARLRYRLGFDPEKEFLSEVPDDPAEQGHARKLSEVLLAAYTEGRQKEIERGITLYGPHRDDLELLLGGIPAKGYASHGESWSYALALRLAAYEVLKGDGGGPGSEDWPVLVLDDVFAELDVNRRTRLAELVSGAEQVLITAAVVEDIPAMLDGERIEVRPGIAEGPETAEPDGGAGAPA